MADTKLTGSTGVSTKAQGLAGDARGTSKRVGSQTKPVSQQAKAPRPAPPAPKPEPFTVSRHAQKPGAYAVRTAAIVDQRAVLQFLFVDGKLPSGFTLTREPEGTRWTLTTPPGIGILDHTAKLSKPLTDAVLSGLNNSLLGLEPDEAEFHRQRERERMAVRLDFLGKEFKGVTVGEVLDTWKSQWWETPTHFVYLGFDPAYRQRVFVWCEVSKTNQRFNNDIRAYLSGNPGPDGKTHTSLRQAIERFEQDNREEMHQIVGAFALAVASAAGQPSFPRGPSIKPLNLQTMQQVASTAINAYLAAPDLPGSFGDLAKKMLGLPDSRGEAEQFHEDMTQAVGALGVRLMPVLKGQVRRIDLGNFGEAIIRQMLEARGYEIHIFQNKSGHGLDIIAIKPPKSGKGPRLVLWGEVKTSEIGSFRLSKAQQNVETYVMTRLDRAATLYTNMTPTQQQAARNLLKEIGSGAAVVSTGAKFFLTVDWANGRVDINTHVWKVRAPRTSPFKPAVSKAAAARPRVRLPVLP